MKLTAAFVLFLFVIAGQGFAQQDTAQYPGAVLVQLSAEHNRIEALGKANRHADADMVREDAKKAAAAAVNDFTDHFDYCPVYYYIDTNIDLIKQQRFEGVLMDANGNILKGVTPRHYLVVWYGYPLSQSWDEWVVKDSTRYVYDPQSRSVKGLVVVDSKFRQIGYIYKLGYHTLFIRRNKYSFSSRRFDIEYMRSAGALNTRLYQNRQYYRVHGTIFDSYSTHR